MKRRLAFTLIELLIVVAIIAILAAIAVPNFLEAQVRAKVSRTKSDIRTEVTALETYRIDHNKYAPANTEDGVTQPPYTENWWDSTIPYRLTTPIAYISTLPGDIFVHNKEYNHFHYGTLDQQVEMNETTTTFDTYTRMVRGESSSTAQYYVMSHGPDLKHDPPDLAENPLGTVLYDPTNGTVSKGDIVYFGPGTGFK